MEHLKDRSFKQRFLNFLSTPFIFGVAIPIMMLDIIVEIYHRVCFWIYGIEYVKRKEYIKVIDRGKLQYLNPLQKVFCMYCGYVNGVFAFWVEIGSRTQKYWCGIKHEHDPNFKVHHYAKDYAEYGDEEDFNRKFKHCKLEK